MEGDGSLLPAPRREGLGMRGMRRTGDQLWATNYWTHPRAAPLALTLHNLASCQVKLLRRAPRKCSAVHNCAGRPDRASTQAEEPVLPRLANPAPNARIASDNVIICTLRGGAVRA
jgi:hypothetical protein